MLNFISWDMDPAIFSIGSLEIRYYGLMWASSFWLGYILLKKIYIKEGVKETLMDPLLYASLIGAVVGARLGHVLFYDFDWYFTSNNSAHESHVLSVLNIREGGLASHGGAIGGILGIAWYVKYKIDKSFLWVIDRAVIVGALIGLFIRIGNFFNSEIIGVETQKPWGVIFKQKIMIWSQDEDKIVYEDFARHPAQLYEAAAYGIVLILLLFLYRKKSFINQEGKMLGFFFVTVFTARYFIEFVKNSQHGIESLIGSVLTTGQLLSVPFVLIGVWLMVRKSKQPL
ncbi:MAG: phosphatidylglycerol:prolipoprotein diacylglycerol transferase [Glaciecola sp.]|jgi:phosphatidylglycerol:prolipoprotein diacylglycerol transferase